MDLSLSDALKDAPPPQPESLVQRDFIATLEAQAFEDKVGETVGKSEYRPLLDVDGSRAGECRDGEKRSRVGDSLSQNTKGGSRSLQRRVTVHLPDNLIDSLRWRVAEEHKAPSSRLRSRNVPPAAHAKLPLAAREVNRCGDVIPEVAPGLQAGGQSSGRQL
ncbi:hypothetical protein Z043_108670 [Scleropages formosus]|uniref:Uncharacterized protein n=1 Tax=Scleropages formosus TaxID=113540 RepID=A0A0P7X611_SCLFO|nr:hypothetical protein Z043_108670 [Scleropages formosus]